MKRTIEWGLGGAAALVGAAAASYATFAGSAWLRYGHPAAPTAGDADPLISSYSSVARSETRAVATDASARRKFRRYWARFSAGIVLIREVSMRLVKKEAERRAGL